MVFEINEQCQADLMAMREISEDNENYNYILTVIVVLSIYAWAKP